MSQYKRQHARGAGFRLRDVYRPFEPDLVSTSEGKLLNLKNLSRFGKRVGICPYRAFFFISTALNNGLSNLFRKELLK